jgi:hypothetical protein
MKTCESSLVQMDESLFYKQSFIFEAHKSDLEY